MKNSKILEGKKMVKNRWIRTTSMWSTLFQLRKILNSLKENVVIWLTFSLMLCSKIGLLVPKGFYRGLVSENCEQTLFSDVHQYTTRTTCTEPNICNKYTTFGGVPLKVSARARCFCPLWLRKDEWSSAFDSAPSISPWLKRIPVPPNGHILFDQAQSFQRSEVAQWVLNLHPSYVFMLRCVFVWQCGLPIHKR